MFGTGMKEWLIKFWEGPVIDRVLALMGIVGISGILGFLGQVVEMVTSYPVPFALIAVVCFSLGAFVSCLLGFEEAQRKKMEQEIDELRTDHWLGDKFRHANFEVRLALYEMYRTKQPYFVDKSLEDFEVISKGLVETGYTFYEVLSDGLLFSLQRPAREFLDGHPGLLVHIGTEWERLHPDE